MDWRGCLWSGDGEVRDVVGLSSGAQCRFLSIFSPVTPLSKPAWATRDPTTNELTPNSLQLWTDAKARYLIEKEYNWFLETYDSYPYMIQRADVIRYFVLAHYG